MEHKESMVKQLKKTIQDKEAENQNNSTYASLNRANDFYNKMVNEGIIKKRGYTLRGIEDFHPRVKLNQ